MGGEGKRAEGRRSRKEWRPADGTGSRPALDPGPEAPQSRFQPWQRSITVDVPDTAPDAALVTWRGRARPMAVTCAAPRRDPMAQGPDTHESRPGRPRMDLQEGGGTSHVPASRFTWPCTEHPSSPLYGFLHFAYLTSTPHRIRCSRRFKMRRETQPARPPNRARPPSRTKYMPRSRGAAAALARAIAFSLSVLHHAPLRAR